MAFLFKSVSPERTSRRQRAEGRGPNPGYQTKRNKSNKERHHPRNARSWSPPYLTSRLALRWPTTRESVAMAGMDPWALWVRPRPFLGRLVHPDRRQASVSHGPFGVAFAGSVMPSFLDAVGRPRRP